MYSTLEVNQVTEIFKKPLPYLVRQANGRRINWVYSDFSFFMWIPAKHDAIVWILQTTGILPFRLFEIPRTNLILYDW